MKKEEKKEIRESILEDEFEIFFEDLDGYHNNVLKSWLPIYKGAFNNPTSNDQFSKKQNEQIVTEIERILKKRGVHYE